MRSSKTLTVTLGEHQRLVDARVASGAFASASEVVRAGLRALEREEAALDAIIRARVEEALDDPRPAIAADEVFARLERKHAQRIKAASRDA